jgi:hypothetical protein
MKSSSSLARYSPLLDMGLNFSPSRSIFGYSYHHMALYLLMPKQNVAE